MNNTKAIFQKKIDTKEYVEMYEPIGGQVLIKKLPIPDTLESGLSVVLDEATIMAAQSFGVVLKKSKPFDPTPKENAVYDMLEPGMFVTFIPFSSYLSPSPAILDIYNQETKSRKDHIHVVPMQHIVGIFTPTPEVKEHLDKYIWA